MSLNRPWECVNGMKQSSKVTYIIVIKTFDIVFVIFNSCGCCVFLRLEWSLFHRFSSILLYHRRLTVNGFFHMYIANKVLPCTLSGYMVKMIVEREREREREFEPRLHKANDLLKLLELR